MTDQESPDRRPLIYMLVAVAILGVGVFIFWPQSDSTPDMVLTPESVRNTALQATEEHAAAGDDNATTSDDPVGNAQVADSSFKAEQSIADSPNKNSLQVEEPKQTTPKPTPTSTTTSKPKPVVAPTSKKPAPTPKAPASTLASNKPGTKGSYLLFVGSFRDQANAEREAKRLQAKDVPADVAPAEVSSSGTIYRVRVGYFPRREDADAYGQRLRRSMSLSYWIGER